MMEMLIVSIIALCLAFITLVIAVKARSAGKKNSEEIAKNTELITANSEEIRKSKEGLEKQTRDFNAKIKPLSDDLELQKITSHNQEQSLRDQIMENNEQANDAILKASIKAKDDSDRAFRRSSEQLASQVAMLTENIDEAAFQANKYADEKIQESNNEFSKKIEDLAYVLQNVIEENKELKRKLEFFAEIREDSNQLNVKEDEEQREDLIKGVLESLKSNNRPVQNNTDTREEWSPLSEEDLIEENKAEHSDHEDSGVQLDAEQLAAYRQMNDTLQNMFITGKAGTGKSFLLEVFERSTEKSIIKLAPTGVAAINIGGATLHSAFGYTNLENLQVEEISSSTVRIKSEKKLILKSVDTIVIDEISMVRADVFDKIDKILQVVNNNSAPFGGKQIIVFGDLFQLPPIAKGELKDYLIGKYGGIYFFQSHAYEEGNFKFVELAINHRQKDDSLFFDILNRMREGKIVKSDIDILNQRSQFDKSELRRVIRLFPTKAQAEEVNRAELKKIEAKEYEYGASILLNLRTNQTPNLESVFPITAKLKLKLGALVMMTANDPEKRWVNGTLGVISFLSNDIIKVDIDGQTYEVKRVRFTEQEYAYENGRIQYRDVLSVEQYPVVLAYAITIHKSQGMTYKKVACDIRNCFESGQAYVALSRCMSLSGLYLLQKVTESNMAVDEEVRDFYLMH